MMPHHEPCPFRASIVFFFLISISMITFLPTGAQAGGPDLYVVPNDIVLDPAAPYIGDVVTVTITVHNSGSVANDVSIIVKMDGQATPIYSDTIPSIATRQTVETFPWNTTGSKAGVHNMTVVLNVLGDTNTTNNTASIGLNLTVRPEPKLEVTGVYSEPAEPHVGEDVVLYANVSNIGSVEAPLTVVKFEVYDAVNLSVPVFVNNSPAIDSIPVGKVKRALVTWPTTEFSDGAYKVLVRTETGGTMWWNITLDKVPLAKVLVTNIELSPPAPIQGEEVTITATVTNSGNGPENVDVLFKDGTSDIGSTQRITVPPNGNATAVVKWTAKKGDRVIRVEVVGNPDAVSLKEVNVASQSSRSCGALGVILFMGTTIGGVGIVRWNRGRKGGEGGGAE